MSEIKSIKAKPGFYAIAYLPLKEIAMTFGYNLVLHGSMNRDMDLIAIPWVDEPGDVIKMLDAFSDYLGVPKLKTPDGSPGYLHSVLPGGRDSYVIDINRGGKWNNYTDLEWYIDISVTPAIKHES